MTTYSNPRMSATIYDWPSGGKRVTAQFDVECDPKRGERAVRTTTGAPKKLTYARKVRIVDGDDGRTYVAELLNPRAVSIMRGDFKYEHEILFVGDPRFPELLALLFDERK